MKEIKSILTENECYKVGKKMHEIRGVLWHSTATPGVSPDRFVKQWNTARPGGRQVCVHSFSDDTKVIQTLPYDMRCWGCGSGPNGSGNNYYIQNEICEPSGVYFENGWKYRIRAGKEKEVHDYIKKAVDVLVEWTVDRLLELGIKEVNTRTVTSHYEAHELGIASGHGDPQGLLSLVGLTMNDVRIKCDQLMKERLNKNDMKNDNISSTSYKVKVTCDELNVRKGPGTSYKKETSIKDHGVYTIVEVDSSGKWGRLKSGAGWIHLGYTEKL